MAYLNYFLPTAEQIFGLLAVLATLAIFAFIGGAVTPGRRFAAVDVFVGWGVACGVFILGGVITGIPFTGLAYILWAAAVASAFVLFQRSGGGVGLPGGADALWRIFVLALPLIFLVAAMKASQWDEFSQWLPNAQYIFRYDHFPGQGTPAITSAQPAYPYALALLTYLASKLSGGFIENGGAIANVAVLLIYALVFITVVEHGLKEGRGFNRKWGVAALGVLGVTVLSTTFVQKLVMTTYADSATSVVLAVLGVLGWKILKLLARDGEEGGQQDGWQHTRSLVWQFAWVVVVLVNLKQANLALFCLLLAGMGLVVWRDPAIRLSEALKLLPVMIGPGILVYLTWRYHVETALGDGEISIRDRDLWLFSEAFAIAKAMIAVAGKKAAYFTMMAVLTIAAAVALGKGQKKEEGDFMRLAVPAATVFVGYNVFLWMIYITVFNKTDAGSAISYWRFNTQLGLLGSTAAAYGVAVVWRRSVAPRLATGVGGMLAGLAVLLVVALPLVTAKSLRFDIKPQKDHLRMVGRDMATRLPEHARVFVIDPNGNGFARMVIRYELTSGPGAGKGYSVPLGYSAFQRGVSLKKSITEAKSSHAWVFQISPQVREALGVDLAAGASHLLKKDGDSWRLLKSWPYGLWDDPYSLPD